MAAVTLSNLACNNDANRVEIAKAGGIPPLVKLLRAGAKLTAAVTLGHLACNNAANTVLIAKAGGIPRLVELLRDGSADEKPSRGAAATVDDESLVLRVGAPGKRKAALVVAALLRACVPLEVRGQADVRDVIRDIIGPYL
ncbi:ubiquitin-protein transferase [Aureococcus anophagefferens]|nr:ubiquitin-protein transferase [Aureococcus anophagefferens]